MGYTNYWTQKKPFNNSQWNIIKGIRPHQENFSDDDGIIEDQTKNRVIIFNGKSKNDQDHETFV